MRSDSALLGVSTRVKASYVGSKSSAISTPPPCLVQATHRPLAGPTPLPCLNQRPWKQSVQALLLPCVTDGLHHTPGPSEHKRLDDCQSN